MRGGACCAAAGAVRSEDRSLAQRLLAAVAPGTILRATTALTPIDATWAAGRHPPVESSPIAAAAVWSACTAKNGSAWHFVMAIDVPAPFPLLGADLSPPADPSRSVHRGWHSPACVDGGRWWTYFRAGFN